MNDIEITKELVDYIDQQFKAFRQEEINSADTVYYDAVLPVHIKQLHAIKDNQLFQSMYEQAYKIWKSRQYVSEYLPGESVITFRS